MDWQTPVAMLFVLLACLLVCRWSWRAWKGTSSGCGSGCGSCPSNPSNPANSQPGGHGEFVELTGLATPHARPKSPLPH